MWISSGTRNIDHQLIADFTKETGIDVQVVPASEASSQRLKQEMNDYSRGLDVVEVDTAWMGEFASTLRDVRAAVADQMSDELPETVSSVVIGDQIVGAPLFVDYGLLFYRTDLLQKYGFDHPPTTWDELGTQAKRIQAGERASGHHNFWGYVWQGANYEGLTCNALEWQYSQGGGNFVTPERKANVANPATVKAFARAAGWVGTISPPGVVAYIEEDSRNIWENGNAAFLRNWGYAYAVAKNNPAVANRFSVAVLPSGPDPHSSVLGGWYLSIPKRSTHQEDALAFIRFMTSRNAQLRRALSAGEWPTLKSLYHDPLLRNNKAIFRVAAATSRRAIQRPITVVGRPYGCVSRVYAGGVHDILTGKIAVGPGTEKLQAALTKALESNQEDCE